MVANVAPSREIDELPQPYAVTLRLDAAGASVEMVAAALDIEASLRRGRQCDERSGPRGNDGREG
ncbi:MAG TPA: hypothetical protein VFB78_14645 [Acidimicrobiales bacterium]|nr:hypothetical protein [Acidimicrobiales bacterium]